MPLFGPSVQSHNHSHHHNTSVTIEEKKASTADDARLLMEVEKQAWESITSALVTKCEDNKLEYIEFEQALDIEHKLRHVQVLFTLNGKKYVVKVGMKNEDPLPTVLETISRAIVNELTDRVKKSVG